MGILTTDPAADGVVLRTAEPSRVLLIAGAPLREPIVQYGPFVMNTRAEVLQAFEDYQRGKLGVVPADRVPHGDRGGESAGDQ
jgi:redox-sensitive bicupin YhaK (pirin superfamily)